MMSLKHRLETKRKNKEMGKASDSFGTFIQLTQAHKVRLVSIYQPRIGVI
jgi:hypothetical protein